MGYVGLACVAFIRKGHQVAGVDIDPQKIAQLEAGESPIAEPSLSALIAEGKQAGLLSFTTDAAVALKSADICFICVGTPPLPDGNADLHFVEAAMATVNVFKDPATIIVIKSTVPVGTCERLGAISNPEFLRQGRVVEDFLQPDRIVVGTGDEQTKEKMLKLYADFDCPKLVMSTASSELTKYAANGFLATKISFINEVANLCDLVGADMREVAQAIGLDPRIGSQFLKAGLGYGGSCFPKDTRALKAIAGAHQYDFKLLSAVIDVNNEQRERFFYRVMNRLGDVKGKKIAVWGLAFKAGTDDVRESAALFIVDRLLQHGAIVSAFDPLVMKHYLDDRTVNASSVLQAVEAADALLVLTDWPEFRGVDFVEVKRRMKTPIIFDGRNLLADLDLELLGFTYGGVGLGRLA